MLSTLNVSYTGLTAARTAVDNISNNIANESTPGYTKRVVGLNELGQVDSMFAGRGVGVNGVYRVTSQYMYDKMMSENTKSNYYEKLSGMLGGVESVFAETDTSGFSVDMNRYFQSLENLRTNPNSEIYRSEVKSQAANLVDSLKNLYSSVEELQSLEKTELSANVDKVNSILKQVAEVNDKIITYPEATNDLFDRRDALELELSNYVDVKVDRSSDFYELKVGDTVVISNNTVVKTIDMIDQKTPQVDKFNYIKYNSDNSFQIYDSMKYNQMTDGTYEAKNLYIGDVVTYKLNNDSEVSVTIGEVIPDITKPKDPLTNEYPPLDINGDGSFAVTEDELVRAMVYKINTNSNLRDKVIAYNGDYSIDANGNKVTDNKQDNFLRIESLSSGIDSSFDGRITIQEQQKYSLYTPQEGDVVSFSNIVTDSDLYNALNDDTKFVNNGNGTFTATATTGEVRILEDEGVLKKFVAGQVVDLNNSTLDTSGEFYKALQSSAKFTNNGDGTYTAKSTAGAIQIGLNESVNVYTPTTLTYSTGDVIDTNSGVVNSGSSLETDLTNGSKFTNNGDGTYTAITSGSVALAKGEAVENSTTGELVQSVTTTSINFNESMSTGEIIKSSIYRNEEESIDPETTIGIGVYGVAINLKSGIIKAEVDNLSTTSLNNKFQSYYDKLDSFAQTLADISDKYIKTGIDQYVYGEAATDEVDGIIKSLGLFNGTSVKTLTFNENAVNDLQQEDLDYLATIQWKTDLSFDGAGQNTAAKNGTSLLEFYRELRVSISADKENVDFLQETQANVTQSIQNSYDNLTKVNKDEEMLDLMKFQAAYTANAKIVTAIDEMIQTLLGLKR